MTTQYRSNILLLLYNYLWTLLYAVGVTILLLFAADYFAKWDNDVFNNIAAITLISVAGLCLLYSVWGGFATITLTDEDVTIHVLFKGRVVLPLAEYNFAPRISRHTINFIQVQSFRYLVASNNFEEFVINLPNIRPKLFNQLIAQLHKAPVSKNKPSQLGYSKVFIVPKEAMLKNYIKIVKGYACISIAISLIIISFAWYKSLYGSYSTQTTMAENHTILWTLVFCLLMFQCPILALYIEYRKRRQLTPKKIVLQSDCLIIDGKQYPMNELRQITVTPPLHNSQNSKIKFRKISISTLKSKRLRLYRFGVATKKGQLESVVFTDYQELCNELQKIAVANDVSFIYDL